MKSKLIILLIVFSLLLGCAKEIETKDKTLICSFTSDIECLNIKYTGNQLFIEIKSKVNYPMDIYEIKAYGAGTCGREMYNGNKFPFQMKAGEKGTIDIVCNNVANLKEGRSEMIIRYYNNYTSQLKTAYGTIE